MKTFQFILKLLLALLASLAVGCLVYMVFIKAAKFDNERFSLFFVMAAWLGGWLSAFVFFIGAANCLYSRFKQKPELHKT